jgi:microsomal prostaglandin-E synthase 1
MNSTPSFLVYAASMVVLSLNILVLWAYSGSVRAKAKVTPNPEDIGGALRDGVLGADPPEVARVLRAHRNATDNIVPFAILGLLFVLLGGSTALTAIFCGVFVVARLAHSFMYLAEKQPWRTVAFVIGGLDTLVMVAFLVRELIARA